MENICSVTQFERNLVNAESALRLGEMEVSILPSATFKVAWRNFDSTKDTVRILSGAGNITTDSSGYTITAGASGCVVAVSNKYEVYVLNGVGNFVNYEFDATQFEWCENTFHTISRAKIKGNPKYLQNDSLSYSDWIDLSEAKGSLDIAKADWKNIVSEINNGVYLVASGAFTNFAGGLGNNYKTFETSPTPISLSYCNCDSATNYNLAAIGPIWSGNIETDLRTSQYYNKIRLDGQVTGRLEKWIEKMADIKPAGSTLRVYSTSSMTLNGQQLIDANYVFYFNTDTVTVKRGNSSGVIGTYTKATSTWTWV